MPVEYVEPVAVRRIHGQYDLVGPVQDEQLQDLIETALEENKDLGIALARIGEARATLGFVRADQFPFIDGIGRAGADVRAARSSRAPIPTMISCWAPICHSRWICGDVCRRSTEAARAELLSTEEAYRNVTISLVANVASFYLLLRDFDERLEISRDTLRDPLRRA